MTKPQDKPHIACRETVRSSRLFSALFFLAAGATFVGLLAITPVLDRSGITLAVIYTMALAEVIAGTRHFVMP